MSRGIHAKRRPIRPAAVSARTHALTRLPAFEDRGFVRTDYHDVEDFAATHVIFEDGTVADIFASEIVLGGIHNWIEVAANNHRTLCNINPNTAMQTYNPAEEQFRDIYVVEKIGTKQGWSPIAPDEDFMTGFPQEIEAFYRAAATGERPEADSRLAADCISSSGAKPRLPCVIQLCRCCRSRASRGFRRCARRAMGSASPRPASRRA